MLTSLDVYTSLNESNNKTKFVRYIGRIIFYYLSQREKIKIMQRKYSIQDSKKADYWLYRIMLKFMRKKKLSLI